MRSDISCKTVPVEEDAVRASIKYPKEQKQVNVNSGQKAELQFEHEDFDVGKLSVSVWKEDGKIKLELSDDRSFNFPEEKGEYVIDVELRTNRGSAQYVGNVVIKR
ncbi:hypothetical protein [Bacillus yapensis]|uniref:hypothetical protein n=1 Tax=Bacillus yapensis TaxID=2492960 RepID=UPI001484F159|nr:hypothetical protein [Bacillus yapensis]